MFFTIDELYDALCQHPTEDIPATVIEAAMEIRNLHIFVQPTLNPPERSKSVWDSCAMILARHSDEELKPHLYRLFDNFGYCSWKHLISALKPTAKNGNSRYEKHGRREREISP